jgi:hypothetical protein
MDSSDIDLLISNFTTQGSEVNRMESGQTQESTSVTNNQINVENQIHPADNNTLDINNNNEKQIMDTASTSNYRDDSDWGVNTVKNQTITSSPIQPNPTISCTPTPMKGSIHALAAVRVALFDFSYTPQPGETFQVNGDGQIIKLNTSPGDLFQTDWLGFLQPVILPLPTLPITTSSTMTTNTGP